MKILEIIHLRLAGNSPQNLVDIIRETIGSVGDQLDIRFYRHTKLSNDLAVHLYREADAWGEDASDVGTRLAALLKDIGMVSHAVWSEHFSLENVPGPNEGS